MDYDPCSHERARHDFATKQQKHERSMHTQAQLTDELKFKESQRVREWVYILTGSSLQLPVECPVIPSNAQSIGH